MNDIFAPVEVVEYSLYLFSTLILVFLSLLYGSYIVYKRRKDILIKDEKYYVNLLLGLDLSDVKRSVWVLEYYLKSLLKTQEQKTLYKEIVASLSVQKYQKNPPPLSLDIQKKVQVLLEELRLEYV